jgi:hypothetical protein
MVNMQPKEILNQLKKLGVSISRKTLYNFEQYGIIQPAEYRDSKTASYPVDSFAEIFAAEGLKELYKGKMKITKGMIKEIRSLAVQAEEANQPNELLQGFVTVEKTMAYHYLILKKFALQELDQGEGWTIERIIKLIQNQSKGDDQLTAEIATRF